MLTTPNNHTHLQDATSQLAKKACKRVSFSYPRKVVFKKMPIFSKNKNKHSHSSHEQPYPNLKMTYKSLKI